VNTADETRPLIGFGWLATPSSVISQSKGPSLPKVIAVAHLASAVQLNCRRSSSGRLLPLQRGSRSPAPRR
jgi:hypothetical protein